MALIKGCSNGGLSEWSDPQTTSHLHVLKGRGVSCLTPDKDMEQSIDFLMLFTAECRHIGGRQGSGNPRVGETRQTPLSLHPPIRDP